MMRKKGKVKADAGSKRGVLQTQITTKTKPPKRVKAKEPAQPSASEDEEFADAESTVDFSHRSDADAADNELNSEASEDSGDDDFELEDKPEVCHLSRQRFLG